MRVVVVGVVFVLAGCWGGPASETPPVGRGETTTTTPGTTATTTSAGTAASTGFGATAGLVAYVTEGDVWLFDPSTRKKQQVTTDGLSRVDRAPQFVGRDLVSFLSGSDPAVLRTFDVVSGATRDIATGRISRYGWSPDTQQVVTLETVGERKSALIFRDVDDGEQIELRRFAHPNELDRGTYEGLDELSLTWSPGSAILFVDTSLSSMTEDDDAPTLFVLRPDGTEIVPPTPRATLGRWSPDGKQIYFFAGDWHVLDASSGVTRRLGFEFGQHPTLSPDGKRVAYHGDGGQPKVSIVDITTGATREVTRGAVRAVWLDNDSLVVTDTRPCPDSPAECDAGGHGTLWRDTGTTSRLSLRTGARDPLPMPSTADLDVAN